MSEAIRITKEIPVADACQSISVEKNDKGYSIVFGDHVPDSFKITLEKNIGIVKEDIVIND